MHNLVLTRFLVAGDRWAVSKFGFRLSDMRICYELAGKAGSIVIGGGEREKKVSVVRDAWLLFERFRERVFEESLPVLLEIDRGTMYMERFKRHLRERIVCEKWGI